MPRLQGRAGIVTGGASGIGRAVARRLASQGAHVAIFDRDGAGARAAADEIVREGGSADAVQVDVSDFEGVARTVEAFAGRRGAPSFLVHAAGWDSPGPFLASAPSHWKPVIDVNLYGALNILHAVCARMKAAGGGRVVCIASDAARTGASDVAVYSACKAGVIALTKSLARELAPGVLINAVSPGPTDTPMLAAMRESTPRGEKWLEAVARSIPLKRLGQPEDIAGMVAFLVGDDAGYITGQTFSVSGGLTMA